MMPADATGVHTAARADLFRCPLTGGPLVFRDGRFVSHEASTAYDVEDGIIDFRCSRRDYYFNPVPRQPMADLTRDARHAPWWKPVRSFLEHTRSSWIDNLVVDGRYAWKLLLDLPPDARILDLGCGLGNLTRNLAPHVARAFAMDLTIERLRFARERFAHFNRDDDIVLLAGGDGPRLPFPDQSLDLVALSGVLEWVGDDEKFRDADGGPFTKVRRMVLSFFGERNPRAVQTRFLQEIRRILKPSGQLFIGIENRLSHEYFYHRVDHHSGLRFASLLPRLVANLYSIGVAHRPYRTYTYSMSGYRRLLARAGFGQQRFYGLTPGYSHLSEVLPFDTGETFWSPVARRGRERLTHNRQFVPAFGIIGSPSAAAPRSLLARTLAAIEAALPAPAPLVAERFYLTGRDRGRVEARANGTPYLITFPFNQSGTAGLQRHRDALEALQGCPALQPFVPEPPHQGTVQGVRYSVERRLPGLAAREGAFRDARASLNAVSELLAILNPTTERTPVALEGDLLRSEMEDPLERLASVLPDPGVVTPLATYLRATLTGAPMPRGVAHGELTLSHVLMTGDRLSGLVGWDYARLAGLPILDALTYLDSLQRALSPGDERDMVERLADGHVATPEAQAFLDQQYEAFHVDRSCHRALVYLQWVHDVCRRLDGYLIYDPRAIDRQVISVLTRVGDRTS